MTYLAAKNFDFETKFENASKEQYNAENASN